MSNQWRRVVAALANPDARRVYAELVAAETAAPGVVKRDKAIRTLAAAGLIELDASGATRTNPTVFADLLAEAAQPTTPESRGSTLHPRVEFDQRVEGAPARALSSRARPALAAYSSSHFETR